LAKANHPDAAGETALPRFLAIQAAYEQLLGPTARRRPGARPGARSSAGQGSAPGSPGPEPWRADPDRARASGSTARDRRRPGARPGGARRTARPADADGDAGPAADPADSASRSPGAGAGQGRSRRSGRRRAPNKATPYSTSYDAADEEPFEPGWSGATWYGSSSGTYWTINPKEYADPRKHGPEYQRRARRSAGGWILDDEEGAAEPADASEAAEEAEPVRDSGAPEPGPAPSRPSAAGPSWTEAHARGGARSPSGASDAFDRLGAQRPPSGRGGPGGGATHPDAVATWPTLPPPRTLAGRVATAFLGWPPIGAALAIAIGEETGCGRFAAGCSDLSAPGTWIVHAAIILLFVALPRLASWSAHGTIAALVVGVPTAVVLSAGGGAREPTASASVLTAILVLAYILGVTYAIVVPRLTATRA
jgi:hypothetical protein